MEKDLKVFEPEILAKLQALLPQIQAYLDEAPVAKIYAKISIIIVNRSEMDLDPGGGVNEYYDSVKLESVGWSTEEIDKKESAGWEMVMLSKYRYTRRTFTFPLELE
jgi:hypothetical protein